MESTELSAKLIDSINLLTKAIHYHADVVGYRADNINPPATDGNGRAVQLELKQEAPPEDAPLITISLDDVRAALNAYATKHGKEKAMEFISKYSPSKKPADIDPTQYGQLIKEAEAA
jgi:hypothetical protein